MLRRYPPPLGGTVGLKTHLLTGGGGAITPSSSGKERNQPLPLYTSRGYRSLPPWHVQGGGGINPYPFYIKWV